MAVATDYLFMPVKHFEQFQKKETLYKIKALIEEEVNLNEILNTKRRNEITSKELQAAVPKLQAALKEMLTSK